MAAIEFNGIKILEKKGKILPEEKKLAEEIHGLLESAGDDGITFMKEFGPVKDTNGLFQLKDYLNSGDYLDYIEDALMNKANNPDTSSVKGSKSSAPQMGSNEELPIDLSKFGDDIDEAPQVSHEPITTEAPKVRVYNDTEVLRQAEQAKKATTGGQPAPESYQPLPEDPDAYSAPAGVGSLDPEDLPAGITDYDNPSGTANPSSNDSFDVPTGAGKTGGPIPDYAKMGNRTDANGPAPAQPSPFGSKASPLNPAMGGPDIDNKEKRLAAESLVDATLTAYEKAHKLFEFLVTVKEEKLMQMEMEGKIDLGTLIPISEDEQITLREFVQKYNEQAAESFEYDKSFNKKVREPMIRVFMKHGWGLTDEQLLMWEFGQDIATKLMIAVSLNRGMKKQLDLISQIHIKTMQNEHDKKAKQEQASNPAKESNDEPKRPQPKETVVGNGKSNFADANDVDFEEVK